MVEETVGGSTEGRAPTADILARIKEAEAKVREMVREAEAQKEKAIADAKREAMEIREKAMKASEALIGQVVKDSDSKIELERRRIFGEAEAAAAEVRAKATSKIDEAKEFLIKDFTRAVDDQA